MVDLLEFSLQEKDLTHTGSTRGGSTEIFSTTQRYHSKRGILVVDLLDFSLLEKELIQT